MVEFRLLACGAVSLLFPLTVPDGAEAGARSTTWVLQRGQDIPSPPPRRPELRIEGQMLSGSTGCNLFKATLSEKADKRVAIEHVALTRMLCASDRNKVEAAVVRALKATEYVEDEGDRLLFLSGTRQPLLEWTREDKSGARPAPRKRRKLAQQRRRPAVVRKDRRRVAIVRDAEGCWDRWATTAARRLRFY